MKGEDKLYEAPFITQAEMMQKWPNGKTDNDMIESFHVDIIGHYGELVCPRFNLVKQQCLCAGYAATFNIGFIVKRVAQLLDLFDDDGKDFGKSVKNCPVRIYHWGLAGDSWMDTICIGHFMKDQWVWGHNLMRTGLTKEEVAK